MLTFNPEKRISAEEALSKSTIYVDHPYFDDLREPKEELPISRDVFDWSWDEFKLTKEALQSMVYEESLQYHPEIKSVVKEFRRDHQLLKDASRKYQKYGVQN